ncbi:ABC transporter permease [Variovorax sp. AFSI2.2]|uniref:ABC transporter permease n=1 Tax=Variovorax sp. AFSI2.2 TaxID=3384160 RepID=UPI003EBCDBC1
MRRIFANHSNELALVAFIAVISLFLSATTKTFFSLGNALDLLNISAVNIIFAVGLLVVLASGGVDISFSVAASVAQYLTVLAVVSLGRLNWLCGLLFAIGFGITLMSINAFLIRQFRVISIIITISTFNVYFGLLMFFTKGHSLFDLPGWLAKTVVVFEREVEGGDWLEIKLPVLAMVACVAATWILLTRTTIGRQIFAFGDNAEAANRLGINIRAIQYFSYGWLGMMAGIAGLMQIHYTKEVVPQALVGRELDVLAAVVLGGARLGGGKGSVSGCVLGVLLIAITQNGLNLMGVSPFAFQMVAGLIIIIAITLSSLKLTARKPLKGLPS